MATTISKQRWQRSSERALWVLEFIGTGGSLTSALVRGPDARGVSPTALRRLTRDRTAEMIAPPADAGPDDMKALEHPDGRLRLRCPIWTETGRSPLAVDFVVLFPDPDPGPDPGLDDGSVDVPDVYIEQAIDTATGLVVLTDSDAPASAGPFWDSPLVGTGEDPRIRLDAPIDDSNLVRHICGRLEQAFGSPLLDRTVLNPGQRAIFGLGAGLIYEVEGALYTYIEEHPHCVRELIWAATHIGAHAHARYLEHAIYVVANYAWDDPDQDRLGLERVEDGQDIREIMVTYIRAHPDEFFR